MRMMSSSNLTDDQISKVKETWGEETPWMHREWVHWTQHNAVQARLNVLASGDPHKNRFNYFMENFLRLPVERAITLGCGHGELERGLFNYNFAKRHDAVDISEGAIEQARKHAAEAGVANVHYRVADLNTIELPRYAYDVIFGIGSFHHVVNIERLLVQVSLGLKPGGYLFLDEYVGPNQFQWSDQQLDIINEQIEAMPQRFRQCLDAPHMKMPLKRHTIEEMNAADPSEAIRSEDILKHVQSLFAPVVIRNCGGSLLHLLLEHIAGNFREDDPEAMAYLQSLFDLEDRLIAEGKLQNDFVVVIAQKKTTWGTWARCFANRLSGGRL
jgi:2-polyprenyl-3-methyl-5-hydroxy-6-metoxy-1,4-benzoquinol methylase